MRHNIEVEVFELTASRNDDVITENHMREDFFIGIEELAQIRFEAINEEDPVQVLAAAANVTISFLCLCKLTSSPPTERPADPELHKPPHWHLHRMSNIATSDVPGAMAGSFWSSIKVLTGLDEKQVMDIIEADLANPGDSEDETGIDVSVEDNMSIFGGSRKGGDG